MLILLCSFSSSVFVVLKFFLSSLVNNRWPAKEGWKRWWTAWVREQPFFSFCLSTINKKANMSLVMNLRGW